MKYKTWRVVKELTENPSLKFESQLPYSLNLEGDNHIVCVNEGGVIRTYPKNIGLPSNLEWNLVKKPVDFITAINSDKEIRSEYWEDGLYRTVFETFQYLYGKYDDSDNALRDINGKWFIEE